jgi:protein-S-isoprenylcysteine O-methyltransferase Ste14
MEIDLLLRNHPIFLSLLCTWLAVGVLSFLVLLRFPAPYGRFSRSGWGPGIPPRIAWLAMESPGDWIFAAMFLTCLPQPPVLTLFGVLWMGHYIYRSIFYPFLLRSTTAVSLSVVFGAIAFHCANVPLQCWELYHLHPERPLAWLWDPRFLAGIVLFGGGFILGVTSDATLRRLRAKPEQGYVIPHGGAFELVSCPNYLGEIIEWTGWALMTWTWSGMVFALWVMANLLPRAMAHHRWYRRQFAEYPENRKALIPYIL